MTKPLDPETEKWIWVCDAEEEEEEACHASDPNAFLDQRCRKCPSGIRRRVGKDDPRYDFDAIEWEMNDYLGDLMLRDMES